NALDAMNHTTNPQLSLIVNPTSNQVELIISDNGCGVSDEMLESMFEPFQTSKKIGEGLGLGLAITANNMRDMNGQITVHKNEQNGLTFTLLFKSA
ncbi:sensor histidine kinase, partial [Vibrio parahaemolyticus]|uniref:sensor histidine kinase n=2 Tax=Vibrionaceae TaxID=641 RepID=UPI0018303646